MRVDVGTGRWGWAGAVIVLVLAPGARAEGLFGSAQVQFQRVEDFTIVQRADGTFERRPFSREFWLQTYDVNHRAYPRQNLLLQSSIRFTDLAYVRNANQERTPTGSMRLIHPWANFLASTQPSLSRVALIPAGASALDSVNATTITLRRRESQFVGHVAPPRWPTLDLSWLQRSRDAVASAPGEDSRQRNVRLGYDRDTWTTFASWTDQRFERRVPGTVASDQRILRGGGSARFTPAAPVGLTFRYDYTGTRSGFVGARKVDSRTHNADAGGDWRHSERWVTSLTANLRRTVSTQIREGAQNDYETALLSTWQPVPVARVTAGGGVRSVRLLEGMRTLRYVTTVASSDGQLRPGWRTNATASNTFSWDPERGAFGVQGVGGASRMRFGRNARFDADLQLTANGDTAAVASRYSNSWGTQLVLQPLRAWNLSGSLRSYRVGASWLRPSGVSKNRRVDLTWKPMPGADVTGSWSSTGLLPLDSPRQVTRSVAARLSPTASLQLTGNWSRSSQERVSTVGAGFLAREVASGRAQLALSRRLTATGSLTVADPGTDRSSKQYDAVVTWSFGR